MGFHSEVYPRKAHIGTFPNKLIFGFDFYKSDSDIDSESTFPRTQSFGNNEKIDRSLSVR